MQCFLPNNTKRCVRCKTVLGKEDGVSESTAVLQATWVHITENKFGKPRGGKKLLELGIKSLIKADLIMRMKKIPSCKTAKIRMPRSTKG